MAMRIFITVGIFMLVSMAQGQTQIPNVFQAGQPARADEVNANFSEIEIATNQNAADIATNSVTITANSTDIQSNADQITALSANAGLQVYSQGESIGNFVRFEQSGADPFYYLRVVSPKGYLFKVTSYLDSNQTDPEFAYLPRGIIYFSDPSCTGTAKAVSDLSIASLGIVLKGWGPTPNSVYYIPRGSTRTSGAYQSVWRQSGNQPQFGECLNESSSRPLLVEVLPNDPEITGVSNFAPVQPITLGAP